MIRFNNDYNHGAHPEILEALGAINGNSMVDMGRMNGVRRLRS